MTDHHDVTDFRVEVPAHPLRAVADRWRAGFDWRAVECRINAWPQVTVETDSPRRHATPGQSHTGARPFPVMEGWADSILQHLLFHPLSAHLGPPAPRDPARGLGPGSTRPSPRSRG